MLKSSTIQPVHPYFPEGLLLSGTTFIPNEYGVAELVGAFGAASALVLLTTLGVVRRFNPKLKGSDQALILWFTLC
jgi:cholestenol delta-isomerase